MSYRTGADDRPSVHVPSLLSAAAADNIKSFAMVTAAIESAETGCRVEIAIWQAGILNEPLEQRFSN